MNKDQPSGSSASFIKSLTEIANISAGVIGYLVALFGLADVRYPKTASLLTLVLTTALVVQWRWRKIAQKKEKKGKAPKGKTTPSHRFLDPVRDSTADLYSLPLLQRRIEVVVLGVLSIATLVWLGISLPAIIAEWTNVPALACNAPKEDAKYRVIVADINQTGTQKLLTADRIFDTLVHDSSSSLYTVCRLAKIMEVTEDAENAIQEYEADVLIWGRSDVQGYEIHLEVPKLSEPDRNASEVGIEEAASFGFQQVEPENVSFVTQFTLTELLVLDGRFDEARVKLDTILIEASQMGVRKENIADAYYLLGLYYDPYFSPDPEIEKAVAKYAQAIDNNPSLFEAWVNRGVLYIDLDQKDAAFIDFTYLIEHGSSEYQGMAYINRAGLQTDPQAAKADLDAAVEKAPEIGYYYRGLWYLGAQEYSKATDDFQQAVLYNPEVYIYYEYLGRAQLHAGEVEDAKGTFANMVPYLTAEDRENVIADLEDEAIAYPPLKPSIDEIIADLKRAEIK